MKLKYYLLFSLAVWAVNIDAQTKSITQPTDSVLDYLLTRTFNLWKGIPMQHYGNMEVIGKTDAERRLKFTSDSTFSEIIFAENRGDDATFLKADSLVAPRKEGYEVSVLHGMWALKNDTIVLNYRQEFIYTYTAINNFYYHKKRTPTSDKELASLRMRSWIETKLLFMDIHLLCGAPYVGCYKADY